jgi:Ca2+-binding EF-hand superfamily protein
MAARRYTGAPERRIRQFSGFAAGKTATSPADCLKPISPTHRHFAVIRIQYQIMQLRPILVCATVLSLVALPAASFAAKGDKKSDKTPAAEFAKLDKDGDGIVTEAEYVDAMKDKLGADGAKTHFAELDKDHDGKLTKDEFGAAAAHAKKHGKKKTENAN